MCVCVSKRARVCVCWGGGGCLDEHVDMIERSN